MESVVKSIIASMIIVMMMVLSWSVFNDQALREKMSANNVLKAKFIEMTEMSTAALGLPSSVNNEVIKIAEKPLDEKKRKKVVVRVQKNKPKHAVAIEAKKILKKDIK